MRVAILEIFSLWKSDIANLQITLLTLISIKEIGSYLRYYNINNTRVYYPVIVKRLQLGNWQRSAVALRSYNMEARNSLCSLSFLQSI